MMKVLFPLFVCLALFSCNSQKKELTGRITAAKLTADSIAYQLKAVDPEAAAGWYAQSAFLRQELVTAGVDTIPVELAGDFDRYFSAMDAIEHFSESHTACKKAGDSLSIRLEALRKDIEADAGERSRYKAFVSFEEKEASRLRKHSGILADQYETAKTAQAQFLPPVERFIRTFADK